MDNTSILLHEFTGIVFTAMAAIFFLVLRAQNIQRYRIRMEMIQRERQAAMEKGIPMPELPEYDDGSRNTFERIAAATRLNPRWPLGLGAILVTGGIGTTIALYLSHEQYHKDVWSMGLIPIFVGFGFFLHYRLTRGA